MGAGGLVTEIVGIGVPSAVGCVWMSSDSVVRTGIGTSAPDPCPVAE